MVTANSQYNYKSMVWNNAEKGQAFVSVIIPCLNERRYIDKLLESIISCSYPQNLMEIIVVDGMSDDGTREIVSEYAAKYSNMKMLDNEKKAIPISLNIGINGARGEVILRLDAHSICERDYISKCVRYLMEYGADNVGGVLVTKPSADTRSARAIAKCLSSIFGSGKSYFRVGSNEPRIVDTVPFGCYRRQVFERVGMFNENFKRSQDMDFNKRLRNAGGKILLVPDIKAEYYPSSNMRQFVHHNFYDGVWATFPLKHNLGLLSVRHMIPLISVVLLAMMVVMVFFEWGLFWVFVTIVALYLLSNACVSLDISVKERDFGLMPFLMLSFIIRHVFYGLGSVWGLIRLIGKCLGFNYAS